MFSIRNIKVYFPIVFFSFYYTWPSLPQFAYKAWTLSIYVLFALLILSNWKQYIFSLYQTVKRNPIISLYLLVCILSFFWATNEVITGKSIKALVLQFLIVVYICSTRNIRQIINGLLITTGISAILSLLVVILLPSIGSNVDGFGQLVVRGVFRHGAALGSCMTMGTILSICLMMAYYKNVRLRIFFGGLTLLSATLLYLSTAAASIGAIVVSSFVLLIYFPMQEKSYRWKTLLTLSLFYLSIFGIFIAFFGFEYIIVDVLGRDLSFTGRLPTWTYLIDLVTSKQPWLGLGFGWGFESNPEFFYGKVGQNAFRLNNSHSGYLQIFIQTGFIGLGLALLSLLIVIRRILILLFYTRSVELVWAFQSTVALMALGVADTYYTWLSAGRQFGSMIFLLIAISTSLEFSRLRQQQQSYILAPPYTNRLRGIAAASHTSN